MCTAAVTAARFACVGVGLRPILTPSPATSNVGQRRGELGRYVAEEMNWRRISKWLLLLSAIVVALAGGTFWFIGGSLIADANRPVGPPPNDLPVETVQIASNSGAQLSGWYIPVQEATATVILLHPIRSDRRAMLTRARLLHDAGYSTLLIDLQGHGESHGENVTAGYRERHDVTAAVGFVRSRSGDHKIAVVGRSLGGAAALLASPLRIDALVVESVYPDIESAIRNRIQMRVGLLHHVATPILATQLKLRLGISSSDLRPLDHIANANCPVLVACGDRDRHTTYTESRRLYDAAESPKRLVVFDGATHTDLLGYDPLQYDTEIVGFLNTHLGSTAMPNASSR